MKGEDYFVGVTRERPCVQPGGPAEWRWIVTAEHGRGDFIASQHELELEVEVTADEEIGERLQLTERTPGWKEFLVPFAGERSDADAHSRLRVPDLIAHHRAETELCRGVELVAERALRLLLDRVPPADELLDARVAALARIGDLLSRAEEAFRLAVVREVRNARGAAMDVRAADVAKSLLLLATITPRPGSR